MAPPELPDAARIAKQVVAAHGAPVEDSAFTNMLYNDAFAELAGGTQGLVVQTLIELTRLVRVATHVAADAGDTSVEEMTERVFRVYDDWYERALAQDSPGS